MTREEKKIEILKAAAIVFSKNGFYAAKMEDIAKQAGIGKGTVYGYFDSKEALFHELLKYGIEEYKEGMEKVLKEKGSVKDKTIELFKYHGKFLTKYIDIAQIFINQQAVFPKELRKEMLKEKMKLFSMLKEMIEQGKKDGELRADLDEELATLSIAGSISQFYGKKVFFDNYSYDEISPEPMVEILFKGYI